MSFTSLLLAHTLNHLYGRDEPVVGVVVLQLLETEHLLVVSGREGRDPRLDGGLHAVMAPYPDLVIFSKQLPHVSGNNLVYLHLETTNLFKGLNHTSTLIQQISWISGQEIPVFYLEYHFPPRIITRLCPLRTVDNKLSKLTFSPSLLLFSLFFVYILISFSRGYLYIYIVI